MIIMLSTIQELMIQQIMQSIYFIYYHIYNPENNLQRFYNDDCFIIEKLRIQEVFSHLRLAFELDSRAQGLSIEAHCDLCNRLREVKLRDCRGLALNGKRVKEKTSKKEDDVRAISSDGDIWKTGLYYVIFSLGRNCPCSLH